MKKSLEVCECVNEMMAYGHQRSIIWTVCLIVSMSKSEFATNDHSSISNVLKLRQLHLNKSLFWYTVALWVFRYFTLCISFYNKISNQVALIFTFYRLRTKKKKKNGKGTPLVKPNIYYISSNHIFYLFACLSLWFTVGSFVNGGFIRLISY